MHVWEDEYQIAPQWITVYLTALKSKKLHAHNSLTDWLTDWMTDGLTYCLTDLLSDWPTDCLSD